MTRDDIIRLAVQAGVLDKIDCSNDYFVRGDAFVAEIELFAELVAAAEREACAKLLDEMAAKDRLTNYYVVAALAIRERGAP